MQININSNQPKPSFKALKAIKFDGKALQNSSRAQNELLTVLEHPHIQNLCKENDVQVEFCNYYNSRYDCNRIYCKISVLDNISEKVSKIKEKSIDKANAMGVSSSKLEGIKFNEDGSYTYLNKDIYRPYAQDIVESSKCLAESVEKEMNNPQKYDEDLMKSRIDVETWLESFFDKIIKEDIESRKIENDEILAKQNVSNKLKELLA